MDDNKRIYFDITTSYYWQGNDVGIVRVEKAIAKILLERFSYNTTFCIFSKNSQEFKIVSNDIILDLIASRFIINEKSANQFWQMLKNFIEFYLKKIGKKLLPKIYHSCTAIFFQDLKKFFYCIKMSTKENYIKYRNRTKITNNKLDFKKNDIYVSLGLDWDKETLPVIYQLKKTIGIQTILYCYDLIVLKFPQFVPLSYGYKLVNYFYELLWCSDYIISISQSTKKDLLNYAKLIGANSPKVEVINIGCDLVSTQDKKIEFAAQHLLINQDFILSVSTFDPRKNYQLLYNIWYKFYVNNVNAPKLVLVGRNGWLCNDLLYMINNDFYLSQRVIVLHDATDEVLNWLYSNCLFTLFPSFYEGWGIPVAESLYYNKYCLASNQGSIPEVAQDLIELLDPYDFYAWYNSIKYLFENQSKLTALEEKIKLNYKYYTLDNMAIDFIKFLHEKFYITEFKEKKNG